MRSVAFAPDGKRLATASGDGPVKVWDWRLGVEAITLRSHQGPVTSVVFGTDGHRLYSGGEDKTVRIWDAAPRIVVGGDSREKD